MRSFKYRASRGVRRKLGSKFASTRLNIVRSGGSGLLTYTVSQGVGQMAYQPENEAVQGAITLGQVFQDGATPLFTAACPFTMQWNWNAMVNIVEIKAMFEEIKLRKVTLKIEPMFKPNELTNATLKMPYPSLLHAFDPDDVTMPTASIAGITAFKERQGVYQHMMNRTFYKTFTPKTLMNFVSAGGAVNGVKVMDGRSWMDLNANTAPNMYGWKGYFRDLMPQDAGFNGDVIAWRVQIKYHVTVKGLQ